MTPPERFIALDGLRGTAALAVVFFHFGERLGHDWLPNAWVAVDTFFVLSGFVLMHAYGRRIAQGMSFGEFVSARLLRLYPLYLAGLGLGALDAALEMLSGRIDMAAGEWWEALAYGLLIVPHGIATPIPFADDPIRGAVFPFNEPAWSLFFELVANIVFYVWLAWGRRQHRPGTGQGQRTRVWRWSLPVVILGAGLAYLAVARFSGGLRGGWNVADMATGFPRVLLGFFIGVALYQCHRTWRSRTGRASWMSWLAPLLAAALLLSYWRPLGHSLVSIIVLAPLAVMLLAEVNPPTSLDGFCQWIGFISYPLYITHFPLFRLLWLEGDIRRFGSVAQLLLAVSIAVAVAWLLAHADQRLRSRIQLALRARTVRPNAS